jgi:UDP-N-acetylglucosamine--N-acetylmuramyl-(pentapeptide) pyrophosphoryl-undecaprenol N-acetylglucosamine transferase
MEKHIKILFAGGGTGGHLYPAISVAEELQNLYEHCEIAFIGSKDKIEGRVVPQLGYQFYPIWISGFQRKLTIKNLLFPVKLIASMVKSLIICMKFKPDIAIGSGGYVSGPAIWAAKVMGAKIVLLEQNTYPGITTRLLEKYADEIHITFEEAKNYLRNKEKVFVSGNPVRNSLKLIDKSEALKKFDLKDKFTVLVVGGSLGSKTLNEGILENLQKLKAMDIQVIWQTGKYYYDIYKSYNDENIKVMDFINDMQAAYSSADIVISRAGASAICEIANLGLPTILVPSPNVTANHQYHNAKALADKNAAILIEDNEFSNKIIEVISNLKDNKKQLELLSNNIKQFGKPEATNIIAKSILKIINIII